MTTYLFLTDPEKYDPDLVRQGKWGSWSCSSTTKANDLALVYLTKGIGVKYEWRVTSNAKREKDEDYPFGCDVKYLRSYNPPITFQELCSEFTRDEWRILHTNFRGMRSIKLSETIADRIRLLRRKKGDRTSNPRVNRKAKDIGEPPDKIKCTTYRILRDTVLAREVKGIEKHRCQICHNNALKLGDNSPYAEAHHIRPLGSPHDGLDIAENILCVCPNCHVLLDYGAIRLEASRIRNSPRHELGQEFVEYHNARIFCK